MKISFNSKSTESKTKKKVLFVCGENAGRSQMEEGSFMKYCKEDCEPISAGRRHKSKSILLW
jgi:protein-tyrosine-phosphatase